MRGFWIAACSVLVIAISAGAQTPHDQKLIGYAKAIPVSRLDAKLPPDPLERWLEKQAGPGAKITWEVNDCGEQTGSPEDSARDFPVCVEADGQMADKRVIVVSVAVGTYQRGIYGKPAVWWVTVGRDPNSDEPLDRLSDVPAELSAGKEAKPK